MLLVAAISRKITSQCFFRLNLDFPSSRVHLQTWYSFFSQTNCLIFCFQIIAGHCCFRSIWLNSQLGFSCCRRIEYSSCVCNRVISWRQNQGSCFIHCLVSRRKRRCFRSSGTSCVCRSHRKVCFCLCSVRGTFQPHVFIIFLSVCISGKVFGEMLQACQKLRTLTQEFKIL